MEKDVEGEHLAVQEFLLLTEAAEQTTHPARVCTLVRACSAEGSVRAGELIAEPFVLLGELLDPLVRQLEPPVEGSVGRAHCGSGWCRAGRVCCEVELLEQVGLAVKP